MVHDFYTFDRFHNELASVNLSLNEIRERLLILYGDTDKKLVEKLRNDMSGVKKPPIKRPLRENNLSVIQQSNKDKITNLIEQFNEILGK